MAEATVQGEIQKKAVETSGVGPDTPRGQAVAEKMRKLLQEKGAKAVLEDARSGKRGVTGAERDRTLSQFNTPADQDRARDSIDTTNRLLTEGYNGLPPTEQDDRRDNVLDAMLANPVMGDSIRGLSPADAEAYAAGVLQDKHFQAIVNQRMQTLSERRFGPTKDQVDARIAQLRAADPTLDKTAARTAALGELQNEHRADLQHDLDNVVGDSAHALIRENLDAADEIIVQNAATLDKELNDRQSEDIANKLERRWSRKNPDAYRRDGAVRQDWDRFSESGIDGLTSLTAEEKAFLNANPDLKKKMEEQVGMSLIEKRMRAGVLKKDDLYRLADAKWMGETQNERVDKIQEVFESHAGLMDMIRQGQAEGYIDKNVWDKVKKAAPYAAGGMLAALAALLAAPLAASAPLFIAAGIGGAGAAGAAKYGYDSR